MNDSANDNTPPIKHTPRILSLDGGGGRGLSTLLILRNLMEEIGRRNGTSTAAKPCDYFDMIGGTSTGGLIAIMLGLLGMEVQECIEAYLNLSKEVFAIDQVLWGTVPTGDNQCRFDYKVLEQVMKCMIEDRLNLESCLMSEATNAEHRGCPTFVVAKIATHTNGPPKVFGSYSGKGVHPDRCPIWQAARATSAAPSYFNEMYIDNPRPGIKYVDGGLGHNNPSEVALDEAEKVWPTSKYFCLVSIGTGRRRAIKIAENCSTNIDDNDMTTDRPLFEQLRLYIPSIVSFVPGWKTATNYPAGVLALINMARMLSKLITDSENVHRRLRRASHAIDLDKRFPYFRFNVERDVGDIGLEDWKKEKEEEIAAYTTSYLQESEVEEQEMECVTCLMNPHEFKRT